MSDKDGGPAFPRLTNDAWAERGYCGMTLRDYFAAKATEEDIKAYMFTSDNSASAWMPAMRPMRNRTQAKYAYADAMLEARK